MRYCTNCRQEIIDDNRNFCPQCGAELPKVINSGTNNMGDFGDLLNKQDNMELNAQFPMKWYKFLIYFALFFSAFISFVTGIIYITGSIYNIQTGGQVTGEMVYYFYSSMKPVDVCYGLALLATAVFSIVTRMQLAKFKRTGPMCVYILYIAGVVISCMYAVGVSTAMQVDLGEVFSSNMIVSIVTSVVMVILNYIYFSKRQALFCN